jgi:lipopolysaccharide/colanic/teichoic acid biosynthesis glycosyltransferase
MSILDRLPITVRQAKPAAAAPPSPSPAASSSHVQPASYFRWKPAIDRFLALVLLLPGLPVIGLLMLLVRLTSRGPGLYRQVRVGKNGRHFKMYKLRTMRQDAEAASGPVWTKAKDPRITLLGRVLRKLHLDELPQLFNVLRGEMSLIGPRPERPEFVKVLAKEIPGYAQRLAVRPGVTGLAQVNLPPDTDLDSVRRKLVLDLQYIRRAGVLLDARLLLCTLGRMFKLSLVSLLGLRRTVTLADPAPATIQLGGQEELAGQAELATQDDLAAQDTLAGHVTSSILSPTHLAGSNGNGNGNGHGSPGRNGKRRKHRTDARRVRPR